MRALLLIPQLVAPVTKSSPAGMNVDESGETYWRAGVRERLSVQAPIARRQHGDHAGARRDGLRRNSVTSPSGESGLNV